MRFKVKIDSGFDIDGDKIESSGSWLILNGRIYNYFDLMKREGILVKGEDELLFSLLSKYGINSINKLNGNLSFVFFDGDKITLFRSIIGLYPIYFSDNIISDTRFKGAKELKRGEILQLNKEGNVVGRSIITVPKLNFESDYEAISTYIKKIIESILWRTYNVEKFVIMDDSNKIIEKVCKRFGSNYRKEDSIKRVKQGDVVISGYSKLPLDNKFYEIMEDKRIEFRFPFLDENLLALERSLTKEQLSSAKEELLNLL